jgi:hypothetical protein
MALKEIGQRACTRMTAGKPGFFTSCHGNGGQPEFWCSDFARWIWWKAGAADTDTLNPAAASFANYGPVRRKPKVGDAVVFNYRGGIHHVAIVVRVNPNGTIISVGGDEQGGTSDIQAVFAGNSSVCRDGPYDSTPGTVVPSIGLSIRGYVSPVEDDMPYKKSEIRQMVMDGVAKELKTELGNSGITPAQGAKAAVHAHQELQQLQQQVTDLAEAFAKFVAGHPDGITTSPNGPAPDSSNGPAPTGTRGRRAGTKATTSPTT